MGPLALVGFASLWAGLGLAEVVNNFRKCNSSFYNEIEPKGFDINNRVNICQKYMSKYYFATFYDRQYRIPIWSAYTMSTRKQKKQDKMPSQSWKVEPQLSGSQKTNMKTETEIPEIQEKALKETQAISADYEGTNYDRGHLNPNSYHCGAGRTATYTLTNAVPMDPDFNRFTWSKLEQNLKKQLKANCFNIKGNPFLVTGAVPNAKYKIPQGNVGRVVVPSHIWTAVCCNHPENNKKFSFAFLGENKSGSTLKSMTVTDLKKELNNLYQHSSIEIFLDDCAELSSKSAKVLDEIKKHLSSSSQDSKPGPSVAKKPKLSSSSDSEEESC